MSGGFLTGALGMFDVLLGKMLLVLWLKKLKGKCWRCPNAARTFTSQRPQGCHQVLGLGTWLWGAVGWGEGL